MSTLTPSEIQKIAELSKLHVPESSLQALSHDLQNILNLVEKMNSVSTESIEPLSHALPVTQPMRKDVVTETNQRELFQSIAPQVEMGLYIVPKFVESE